MSDTHPLWFLTIPPEILVALDYRPFHFALQPVHHLVRLLHILSISAFFGAIGLLDLRLMGLRSALPLKLFSEHALPWLYATFGIAVVSGIFCCSSTTRSMSPVTPISRSSSCLIAARRRQRNHVPSRRLFGGDGGGRNPAPAGACRGRGFAGAVDWRDDLRLSECGGGAQAAAAPLNLLACPRNAMMFPFNDGTP